MKSLVSVLIPMYNHGHYIEETLRSVLSQTYKNFECLVLDDGSKDEGAAIVQSIAKVDRRVRLLSQSNKGLVAALNVLASKARGDYITTLDADDCFLPCRLEMGVLDLHSSPKLAVSFCGVETMDGHGAKSESRRELYRDKLDGPAFYSKLVCHNFVASCAGLIRRPYLEMIGKFARSVEPIPDWDLWLRLAKVGEMALRREIGVRVRWDGTNMSGQRITEGAAQLLAVSREHADGVCRRHGLSNVVRAAVCDMRIGWSRALDKPNEVLRALGEKRRFVRFNDADWVIMIAALLVAGKIEQARHFLHELTKGLLRDEVTDATRDQLSRQYLKLAAAYDEG